MYTNTPAAIEARIYLENCIAYAQKEQRRLEIETYYAELAKRKDDPHVQNVLIMLARMTEKESKP